MPQTSTISGASRRAIPPGRSASRWFVITVASVAAACAYVGLGYAAFEIVGAITGDPDVANWVAACLSIPLAAPLIYAVNWIEKRL